LAIAILFFFVILILVLIAILVVILVLILIVMIYIIIRSAACRSLGQQCAGAVGVRARHGDGDVRQDTPDQTSTGNGDGPAGSVTRENISWNSGGSVEVDSVTAAPTDQNTLHACAPLAMTTWNPLPVRAAPTLKVALTERLAGSSSTGMNRRDKEPES
jgi:hypothetical protein